MSTSQPEELADSDAPVGAKSRRYHEALLGAFVAGATVNDAATQAGVSRRTTQRWKVEHWEEVVAARREILDGLMSRVRGSLPIALERLTEVARSSEDESVAVRASLGLWEIFGRVSDRMEIEERLALLEKAGNASQERK